MFPDKASFPGSILIVGDIPNNILVLRSAVQNMGELHFAMDGPSALEIGRQFRPDVVLLDMEMPGMDGFNVCVAIKSDPQLADASVIFIASSERESHELQALHFGGVDFLQKPLNIPVARARIQAHLNLRRSASELAVARRDLADVVSNLPAFIADRDKALSNHYSNDIDAAWFGLDDEQVGLFANRLLQVVSESYCIAGNRYDLSVSIGISIYPNKDICTAVQFH
ncbi:MAG: response regulator [Pseudomonadota bacterium]